MWDVHFTPESGHVAECRAVTDASSAEKCEAVNQAMLFCNPSRSQKRRKALAPLLLRLLFLSVRQNSQIRRHAPDQSRRAWFLISGALLVSGWHTHAVL